MDSRSVSASPAKKWAVSLAVALGLSGCSGVASQKPFGEKPHELVLEEWEGNWLSSDNEVGILTVVDADEGLLLQSWVEEDYQRQPVLKSSTLHVRESAGWLFISMPEDDDTAAPDHYYWGRVKNDGRNLMVWLPRADKFERLVKEGALPGRVESGDVILSELDSSHYALIASEERGVLFDWDEPILFRRIEE